MTNKKEKEFTAFFVITLYVDLKDPKLIVRTRTPGYFLSFERAEQCILNNEGDLYEIGYYNYAIIEEHEEGLYPFSHTDSIKWYEVQFLGGKGTGEYEVTRCEPPHEDLAKTIGYSIG